MAFVQTAFSRVINIWRATEMRLTLTILCLLATPSALGKPQVKPGMMCAPAGPERDVLPRLDALHIDGEWVGNTPLLPSLQPWVDLTIRGTNAVYRSQLAPGPLHGVVARNGQLVTVTLPNMQLSGTVSADGMHLDGTWKVDNTAPMPVDLMRHPQTPIPPFPYDAEAVEFTSADGYKLSGTLTLPKGRKNVPAVILAVGSVPTDRDYLGMMANPSHRIFAVLADDLTRRGIAVLRFDQRGTGQSGDDPLHVTESELEADFIAGISFLARKADVDSARIGMIGHSAGGVRTVRLLNNDPQLAFGVLLASPATPMLDFTGWQIDQQARAMGLDDKRRAEKVNATLVLARAVLPATSYDDANERIRAALKQLRASGVAINPLTEMIDSQWLATEPYRFLLGYDPQPDLRRIRKPVLAIVPGADRSVNPEQAAPLLREGLANDARASICLLPGVDHNLQFDAPADPGQRNSLPETISPSVLNLITNWITEVAATSR